MFEAIVIGCLVVVSVVGGKALLAGMAALPVIGGFAGWYAGLVGSLPEGVVSNLIYGAIALQIVLLPLSGLLYGPGLVKRVMNKLSQQKAAA